MSTTTFRICCVLAVIIAWNILTTIELIQEQSEQNHIHQEVHNLKHAH